MSASDHEEPEDTGFLPFSSICGRRGCTHVYAAAGLHPFAALAEQVAAHAPHCAGNSATHRCIIEWQPPPEVLYAFDAGRDENRDAPRPRCGGESADGARATWAQAPGGTAAHVACVSDTQAAESPAGSASASSQDDPAAVSDITAPRRLASSASPPRKKKSARTEEERIALLAADAWALRFDASKVVCRGCERAIQLDRRSRYYPGLWLKHRTRCPGVGRARARARAGSAELGDIGSGEQRVRRSRRGILSVQSPDPSASGDGEFCDDI